MVELLMSLLVFGTAAGLIDGNDENTATTGDDTIEGTESADNLEGNAGNDSISGNAGDDVLTGFVLFNPEEGEIDVSSNLGTGTSNLLISGDFGADTLIGGAGNDVLFGTVDSNADGNIDDVDTDSAADSLNGGEGDDTLYLGNDDVGTGGEGADTFISGTWVEPGSPVVINDFDENEDTLVIQFQEPDDDTPPPMDVTIETLDSDAIVSLNGQALMRIIGGGGVVTPEMINLVEASLS